MDLIYNNLKNLNQDCSFSEKILESESYSENNNLLSEVYNYTNFLFCILDKYDLILSNTEKKDKKIIFNKRVFDILSELEDNIDSYNYNEKIFSFKKIQQSLQECLKKKRYISCIYFLNDLYKTHFVIVNKENNTMINTTLKNYPKIYLICENNSFRLETSEMNLKQEKICDLFEYDIKKSVYKSHLKAISNYKIDELKNIAKDLNMNIYVNGKILKKQIIYDNINLHYLNLTN